MISDLGRGLVLLALLTCALGAPVGFFAGAARSEQGLRITRWLALAFAASMLAANVLMEVALLRHDFSVSYVASVGSLATPWHITLVSLWSSLEGSILFWGLVLGGFTAAFAYLQRRGHEHYLGYSLGTLFAIGLFFAYLIAGPANPFAPTPEPIPPDGPGPNPLLQNHALMIIHPPMLYFGYVGMSVPFAMAVAALLRGQLGPTWLRPMRNWLLVPTGFLTLGIMLGGWWSYEVLGWGGYWAWDPVENASFLPWLTAVAALHSALVQQRRGSLKAWTTVLVLITFLLTILGTFLTRSGVVNSVHSFTQSPIGPLFLIFLGICLVGVVILLALRVDTLVSEPSEDALLAREGAFLVNNLLLVAFTFTVLIGTIFPIVAEAVRGVQISVGEPYFNRMAVPICFALLMLMGVGPALPWGQADPTKVRKALLMPIPAAIVALAVTALLGGRSWELLLTGAFAGYALWVTGARGTEAMRRRRAKGESPARRLGSGILRSPRLLGAYVVHFGVIVTFVSIAISSSFQTSHEAVVAPGEAFTVADYSLTLDEMADRREPHRLSRVATLTVSQRERSLGTLSPAINQYPSMREPIGTPAVRTGIGHDLYLTLMNTLPDGRVGIRAIITPAVVWIWIGVFIMTAGMAICLIPRRSVREAEA